MEERPIGDVDWQGALKTVSGQRDLLVELIGVFFREYPDLLKETGTAIERRQARDIVLYAHRLNGCLRYFGRNRAGEAASQLETAARAGDLDAASGAHRELCPAVDDLVARLRTFRDSGVME
jgi:HPt (histidine-containing phosphotransfer) domain-containing protein